MNKILSNSKKENIEKEKCEHIANKNLKSFVVVLTLSEPDKNHYGTKIDSFKRIDSLPEGEILDCIKNISNHQASVSNYDFGDLTRNVDYAKMTDEEIDEDAKYVVSALRYVCVNENVVALEFDEDSYDKFIFVTKMDKGACFSAE